MVADEEEDDVSHFVLDQDQGTTLGSQIGDTSEKTVRHLGLSMSPSEYERHLEGLERLKSKFRPTWAEEAW